ncbi:uncharacterized protein LOC106654279 [Trichogramma pretiosum]|uniref:uncharacterized protein LOC106654279 n=1 Tax=Trichogramma pretiosum TaxID=7493 RepID=UPI0006C943DE|nr:uncharacterized protein LOC106654279 [Trichogramma pretiosum]
MESTGNFTVRVKEEPRDPSFIENDSEMIDEKPDLKNFQLSPFPQENSTHALQKCIKNHVTKINDDTEIVFECENLKPRMDLLVVQKVDDYSENHFQNVKNRCYDITLNRIKMERKEEVKEEFFDDVAEKLNLNFDCELVEQKKERRITKKLDDQHNLKTNIHMVSSGRIEACEIYGKKFTQKGHLNVHIDAGHNGDSIHNGVNYTCDVCGKAFAKKPNLRIHIDSVHNGVTHSCDKCGKSFTQKDSVHNDVKYACDICGKTFVKRQNLRVHIDTSHSGVKYACDKCGKSFTQKGSLKRHIDTAHIGRSPSPASVTTALAGDGVGTFVTFPLRKESARALSREDLAEEAARVLEQADSVDCVARGVNNRESPRKYASLPGRGSSRKSKERSSNDGGGDTDGSSSYLGHSKPKKKALGRSVSDASSTERAASVVRSQQPSGRYQPRYQGSNSSPDRSLPELEEDDDDEPESQYQRIGQPRRRGPPLQRSSSDLLRKQQQPPLTPIIEASPHPATAERSFRFSSVSPPAPVEPSPRVKTIPIYVESENRLYVGDNQRRQEEDIDVVDGDMLHRSSRYDHHPQQPQRDDSTIHKMIHRLSNDRSPPPQLTRAMVAPSPGFAHNNNRPFSYTRPSEIATTSVRPQSPSTTLLPADCIYAQVQMDKKKSALLNQAQRSHSDSDEGLGLERKDSSRENSPADKEAFHRSSSNNGTGGQYRYLDSELQRHNDINSYKSSSANNVTTTRFGDGGGGADPTTTTTVLDRGRADGMADAARRRVNGVDELSSRVINERPPSLNKSSDLSARRDLLESRIKMFSSKDNGSSNVNKLLSPSGKKLVLEQEPIIVDKPIVPSPVVPAAQPKRYLDTYISETRTNSNGEKYIFEKEMHDENGKVYGFEKITNKVTNNNGHSELPLVKPKQGYVLETRTDKYGDKYIVETRNYSAEPSSTTTATIDNGTKKDEGHSRHHRSELYQPRAKKNFEAMRGYSKSTQRLNELSSSSESPRVKDGAAHRYVTRSYENLASSSSAAADLTRRPGVGGGRRPKLGALREGPLDDYDTDISQATNSQLDSSSAASKFYSKETRTMQRYHHRAGRGLHDDYDSSPPRHHRVVNSNGYNSSRYDSDTTTRDSVVRGGYHHHRKGVTSDPDEPKKPLRRSRNHLDYAHLDERSNGAFDEGPVPPPQRPPRHNARDHHRGLGRSSHHNHHHQVRTETRLSDSERKDRLADSGIENDYRPTHSSHEADGRHGAESEEDDGFVTAQFLKQERRHTDRSMPIDKKSHQQQRVSNGGYDKYVMYYNDKPPLTGKPPLGPGLVDAGSSKSKYEKKAAKKSGGVGGVGGTMSKVRELFRKKEKKQVKEDKTRGGVGGLLLKRSGRAASTGALTDDEVTVRYREYRGDQLRSARSARDLDSEINERQVYRQNHHNPNSCGDQSKNSSSRYADDPH